MKTCIFLPIILLGQIWCFSASAQVAPTVGAQPSPAEEPPANIETCPDVRTLVQVEDMSWIAPDGWKSSGPALYRELNQFVGAQWIGVNVGEVICIYAKEGRNDFPVNLQRPIIALSPYGKSWTEDKGGYKDCKASDPAECPFQVKVASAPKNVYDELDFHKDKSTPNDTNHP